MNVQMLEKPLEGSCGKDVLQVLMALLPELFDENVKAVTLIGTSLGDMIVENQLTPTEVCSYSYHSITIEKYCHSCTSLQVV